MPFLGRRCPRSILGALPVLLALVGAPAPSPAAYEAHGNDRDVASFREAHPGARGGRLDDCSLCHAGGERTDHVGKVQRVDTCTHCHDTTRMGKGPLRPPLNRFGNDYLANGRSVEAVRRIGTRDSDGDGFGNAKEIEASTFPGDPTDRPGLARPPMVRLDRKALEALPRRAFTLLVNTHKSGDFYAPYEGVSIEALLAHVGALPSAERVTFFCPDGYQLTLPLAARSGYHLRGDYPRGSFFPGLPWVSYPAGPKLRPGEPLPGTPCALLAFRREGAALAPGHLAKKPDGRLTVDGEGPYRLIVPQAVPSVPDQPSNRSDPAKPHPFDGSLDHNGGVCVRSIVALRVEPLPPGAADLDWSREGWHLVETGGLVVYGALRRP